MSKRLVLLVALIVLALAAAGALAWRAGIGRTPGATGQGQPAVGGPFQLVNQDGEPVDEQILKGKWTAVFFGFTYCPDVCPTTLQALGQAKRELGKKGDRLQVVFVSVDPARDTPAQLKSYLDNEVFPAGTIGLTGTQAQVDAAAKAYRAFAQKAGEGEGYLMEHTSTVYLMDPQGRFDRPLHYGLPPEQLKVQILDAMG